MCVLFVNCILFWIQFCFSSLTRISFSAILSSQSAQPYFFWISGYLFQITGDKEVNAVTEVSAAPKQDLEGFAYEQIKTAIVKGIYPPGYQIV